MFTSQQIDEIYNKLQSRKGVKNSDFEATDVLKDEDIIVLVQDGKNKKITIAALKEALHVDPVGPEPEPKQVKVTVTPTPSYADVIFSVNDDPEVHAKSIYVDKDSVVKFVILLEGYKTYVSNPYVISENQTFNIVLEKNNDPTITGGTLTIVNTNPVDCKVSITTTPEVTFGKINDTTWKFEKNCNAVVTFSKEGYKSVVRQYTISEGNLVKIDDIELEPLKVVESKNPKIVNKDGSDVNLNISSKGGTIDLISVVTDVYNDGSTKERTYEAEWTATGDVTGITQVLNGKFTINPNEEFTDRSFVITAKDIQSSLSASITINQYANTAELEVMPDKLEFTSAGGEKEFRVITAKEWTIN